MAAWSVSPVSAAVPGTITCSAWVIANGRLGKTTPAKVVNMIAAATDETLDSTLFFRPADKTQSTDANAPATATGSRSPANIPKTS